jgi:hypothetical protein
MGRAAVIVALVAGVALAGCSGSGDDGADSGIHARLERSTLFETRRALSLTVRSDREDDVRIAEMRLDSPLFDPMGAEDREARVRPGRTTGVPLPYGEADCGGEAGGPAELLADVDGEEVRVPIVESPSDLLATLQGNECAEAAVREQVDLELGGSWERVDPTTIEGDVVMAQRRDGATAAIEQMTGNVLFTVATEAGAGDANDPPGTWIEVSDRQPSVRGRLRITVSRCDPHALIEFKTPFVLTGFVALGGAEAVRVDIEAQGAARRTMGDLMSGCLGAVPD